MMMDMHFKNTCQENKQELKKENENIVHHKSFEINIIENELQKKGPNQNNNNNKDWNEKM